MALFCSFYGWVVVHCVYMHHIFFIPSSVSGHLGCSHVTPIVNSDTVNIRVHVSFWIIVLSGYMPRGGTDRSYRNSILRFLRNLHTVVHSGCTYLHSPKWFLLFTLFPTVVHIKSTFSPRTFYHLHIFSCLVSNHDDLHVKTYRDISIVFHSYLLTYFKGFISNIFDEIKILSF